ARRASHSAAIRPNAASLGCGEKLRNIAAVAPIHHNDITANSAIGTVRSRQKVSAMCGLGMSGAANLTASIAASPTSVSANMADSAVLRTAGGTNSAATAASSASHATVAFSP